MNVKQKTTDPRAFGRVAVLMGGASSEREVSLNSGANVLAALQARGVDAHAVDGIPALVQTLTGNGARYDRVFNILHGNKGGGEDGVLQGLCEALGVPCTGSGVLGTALAMDKIRSKQVWLSLGLPVIVKPSCEGSSVGVSRVFNDADLEAAVELAARYPGELLMEQLIVGQELTVAILGDEALPSIRIVPAGEYYDYHAKYVAEATQYLCPGLEGEAEANIRRLALDAFHAIGCEGWARVDVMRDEAGRFFLLEVNTAPGMTSHSLVPKAAAEVGVDFEQLCWMILETSLT